MKRTMIVIVFMAIGALLLSGCGKRIDWKEDSHSCISIVGADLGLSVDGGYIDPNYADALYYESYRKGFPNSCGMGYMGDCTAWSKRAAALDLSREVWTYSFKSYLALDGVSGFIYNMGYLCSVPHKIVRGLFCMDGVVCYGGALVKLLFGSVCAVVGLVAAPVINTICHPLETLANLTVGFVCYNQSVFGLTYTRYIFHTNIIASLFDLIWGAMIYPLIQTFLFWM